jgi:two-component SAPR family response regulator
MRTDPDLSEHRVLVVEDEFFIAEEINSALERCHATVVGPVPTIAEARKLAHRERPDCAILDINVRGEMIFDFADELRALTVPFVFASGYDAPVVPPRFSDVPRVEKPLNVDRLIRTLARRAERGTG